MWSSGNRTHIRFPDAARRRNVLTHSDIRIIFGSMPTMSMRQPNGGAPGRMLRTDGRANSEVRQIDRTSEPLRIYIRSRMIASPVSMHIESVMSPKRGTNEKLAACRFSLILTVDQNREDYYSLDKPRTLEFECDGQLAP